MKHEKTFAAIAKLQEVEVELHRLKNALEMANKALDTKDASHAKSAAAAKRRADRRVEAAKANAANWKSRYSDMRKRLLDAQEELQLRGLK